jgi:hypothetical protein
MVHQFDGGQLGPKRVILPIVERDGCFRNMIVDDVAQRRCEVQVPV